MAIHTIPVPEGWSPEQAWEAIRRGVTLPWNLPITSWVNVDDKTGVLVPDEEE